MDSKKNTLTFWQEFRNHFVAGLLVLAPLFLTLLIISYLVRLTDNLIVNPLFQVLPIDTDATFKIFITKFTIAVIVIILIALIGLFGERFVLKRVLNMVEGLLLRIPLFNRVYGSLREIAQAFFGDKTGIFKRVAFVEYPRKGILALAFVMQEKRWEIHEKTGKDIIVLFVPSPPNPATGLFVFAPKEEVIDSDMSVEEGLKLVISGGAAVPPLKK